MTRKYTIRSKEEKLAIVKQVLAGKSRKSWEPAIHHTVVADWVRRYLAEGEAGLAPKKRAENPLLRFQNRKELSFEEQLLYQIELLKLELAKKEAEVERLKQRSARKEGDAPRE